MLYKGLASPLSIKLRAATQKEMFLSPNEFFTFLPSLAVLFIEMSSCEPSIFEICYEALCRKGKINRGGGTSICIGIDNKTQNPQFVSFSHVRSSLHACVSLRGGRRISNR